jgi:hypothetical protein
MNTDGNTYAINRMLAQQEAYDVEHEDDCYLCGQADSEYVSPSGEPMCECCYDDVFGV